jgi:hypothetical protein
MSDLGVYMQKYYCKEKKGKIKKGGYKNGRGYCGWYTNNDGRKVFLRSKKEYIYALYLDKNGQHFLLEKSIFVINEINYKPDFFIYNEDYTKLLKIVEVKQCRKDAEPYWKFKDYFASIGIEYEIEYGIEKIKRKWATKSELNKWDKQYLKNYPKFNMSGKLNPMYGMKHSASTKKKIGQQTRKYMQDENVKSKHSASLKAFWKSDKATALKQKYATLRTKEATHKNPVVVSKCVFCGKEFEKKLNDKSGKKRYYDKQTCSASCVQKYNWQIGKMAYHGDARKTYKTRILKYLRLTTETITTYNFEDIVAKLKNGGLVPKHFSLNKNVIEKYFGSVEDMTKEL